MNNQKHNLNLFERLCDDFLSAAERNYRWSIDREITLITCQEMHKLLKIIRQILPKYIIRDKNSKQLISNEQAAKEVFDRFMIESRTPNLKFDSMVDIVVRDLLNEYDIQSAE